MPSLHFSFIDGNELLQFFPKAGFWNKDRHYEARTANLLDSLRSQNFTRGFAIIPAFAILESDRKYFLTDVFCPIEQVFGKTFPRENAEYFNKY